MSEGGKKKSVPSAGLSALPTSQISKLRLREKDSVERSFSDGQVGGFRVSHGLTLARAPGPWLGPGIFPELSQAPRRQQVWLTCLGVPSLGRSRSWQQRCPGPRAVLGAPPRGGVCVGGRVQGSAGQETMPTFRKAQSSCTCFWREHLLCRVPLGQTGRRWQTQATTGPRPPPWAPGAHVFTSFLRAQLWPVSASTPGLGEVEPLAQHCTAGNRGSRGDRAL